MISRVTRNGKAEEGQMEGGGEEGALRWRRGRGRREIDKALEWELMKRGQRKCRGMKRRIGEKWRGKRGERNDKGYRPVA